ncbi:hypothetical protein [Streptomyces sp. T21Q-yed]|uniref:NHL domain-containing protein n=1 Tax=Streptomyces sp. T21Q-yed TaxID=3018441 RepID=UPI0023E01242|nr:hypothetical protein [Streptomyces sp. T21Q-yed]MDF3140941.1 hypothetical protein [Streptomyces sp. T21Q-yed]
MAGSGEQGYGGDGGPATRAALQCPCGVAPDGSGNLYLADRSNQRVRKVSPDGTITTVAGNGTAGFSGDGGPATSAALNFPHSVAVDATGTLYIADDYNHRVRKVSPDGIITTLAGTGVDGYGGDGGPATSAALNFPHSVAVDATGTLYIADRYNHRVRKVSPDGIITTLAGTGTGTGTGGYGGDGGPATSAALSLPHDVIADSAGNVHFSDYGNKRLRTVSRDGFITTLAGTGVDGYGGDGGPATSAALSQPLGVTVDADGTLYFCDWGNHRVRMLSTA